MAKSEQTINYVPWELFKSNMNLFRSVVYKKTIFKSNWPELYKITHYSMKNMHSTTILIMLGKGPHEEHPHIIWANAVV